MPQEFKVNAILCTKILCNLLHVMKMTVRHQNVRRRGRRTSYAQRTTPLYPPVAL